MGDIQMSPPSSSKGTGQVSSIISTLLDIIGILLLMSVVLVVYHKYFVVPYVESERTQYFVADIQGLADAKVISIMQSQSQEEGWDNVRINAELLKFQEMVSQDVSELTGDSPVFQKGTLLNVKGDLVDITDQLAQKYQLILGLTLQDYLKNIAVSKMNRSFANPSSTSSSGQSPNQ